MPRKWDTFRMRQKMRRQGVEDARGEPAFMQPLIPQKKRRPQPSKAQQRAEGEAAVAAWKARNE